MNGFKEVSKNVKNYNDYSVVIAKKTGELEYYQISNPSTNNGDLKFYARQLRCLNRRKWSSIIVVNYESWVQHKNINN